MANADIDSAEHGWYKYAKAESEREERYHASALSETNESSQSQQN